MLTRPSGGERSRSSSVLASANSASRSPWREASAASAAGSRRARPARAVNGFAAFLAAFDWNLSRRALPLLQVAPGPFDRLIHLGEDRVGGDRAVGLAKDRGEEVAGLFGRLPELSRQPFQVGLPFGRQAFGGLLGVSRFVQCLRGLVEPPSAERSGPRAGP